MVLELCAYGSLADVLRGNDSGRVPLALKPRDKIFLALGCARYLLLPLLTCSVAGDSVLRGVAALHALSEKIVHRDIKSFNFLGACRHPSTPSLSFVLSHQISSVDSQFNAKLADLELGINTMIIEEGYEDEDAPTVDDFLVNWVAPEVFFLFQILWQGTQRKDRLGLTRRIFFSAIRYLCPCLGAL
jgi:serine/threonine protein kinase